MLLFAGLGRNRHISREQGCVVMHNLWEWALIGRNLLEMGSSGMKKVVVHSALPPVSCVRQQRASQDVPTAQMGLVP